MDHSPTRLRLSSDGVYALLPPSPRRAPTDVLGRLPHEVLVQIFGFLGVQGVVRLRSTCRRMMRAVDDQLVWRELYELSFGFRVSKSSDKDVRDIEEYLGGATTPLMGVPSLLGTDFLTLYKIRLSAIKRLQHEEMYEHMFCRANNACGCLLAFTSQTAVPILMTAFVVFLTQRLSGAVSWSWMFIFSPLLMLSACCLAFYVACLILFALRTYEGDISIGGVAARVVERTGLMSSASSVALFLYNHDGQPETWRIALHASLVCCTLALVPVTLLLRLKGFIGSWWLAFIPLYILLTMPTWTPMVRSLGTLTNVDRMCHVGLATIGALLIAQLILIAYFEEESEFPITILLLPIWLINGFLVLCTITDYLRLNARLFGTPVVFEDGRICWSFLFMISLFVWSELSLSNHQPDAVDGDVFTKSMGPVYFIGAFIALCACCSAFKMQLAAPWSVSAPDSERGVGAAARTASAEALRGVHRDFV